MINRKTFETATPFILFRTSDTFKIALNSSLTFGAFGINKSEEEKNFIFFYKAKGMTNKFNSNPKPLSLFAHFRSGFFNIIALNSRTEHSRIFLPL